MSEAPTLPLASEEKEQQAQKLFDTRMSPEEFVGRYGDNWDGFSFAEFRFQNAALNEWIIAVHNLMNAPDMREQCRKQFEHVRDGDWEEY